MALNPSGYTFPALNSDGSFSSTIEDFSDMFVSKLAFLNSGVYGWGQNVYGELGNNSTVGSSSPTQIGSLTNWKTIKHDSTSMGIKDDGTLWTWGSNQAGALGIPAGAVIAYSSPVQVGSLTNWKQVSAGYNYCLAIKTDGTLWSWGINTNGQLGINAPTGLVYSSPVQIGSLTNWAMVSGNYYSAFAIRTDGTLWGWGLNQAGQLGNGAKVDYSSPIQIGTSNKWKSVTAGYFGGAGIQTDGTLWAWGTNFDGQLGNSSIINVSTPIQIGSLSNWKQVAASGGVSTTGGAMAAVKNDGTLWAWGFNVYGNLGNNTTVNYSSPIQIGALTNWKFVAMSQFTDMTYAIKTDGTLWSWGFNLNGALGLNNISGVYSSPVQVGSLIGWRYVTSGGNSTGAMGIYSPDLLNYGSNG